VYRRRSILLTNVTYARGTANTFNATNAGRRAQSFAAASRAKAVVDELGETAAQLELLGPALHEVQRARFQGTSPERSIRSWMNVRSRVQHLGQETSAISFPHTEHSCFRAVT
jgi:hypothetical protein